MNIPPPGPSANRFMPLIILGAGLLLGALMGAVVFFGPAAVETLKGMAPVNVSGGPTSTPAPAPVVGAPAPNFTLDDLASNPFTLSAYKGQVILINFWATWCGPCREEMPAIERQYEALKDAGLVVLAVNLDEPITEVSAFAHEYGLTFPVLLDSGAKVNDAYRVRAYPTTFILNREGVISRLHIGSMTEDQLTGYLSDLGLK